MCLTILKGVRVGFVGATGRNKSTMLDLLMGLLDLDEGKIAVDGCSINGDLCRAWQQSIAHVPQNIHLADTTLVENVAFGVSPEVIDMGCVCEAVLRVQIAEFIEAGPEGCQASRVSAVFAFPAASVSASALRYHRRTCAGEVGPTAETDPELLQYGQSRWLTMPNNRSLL